MSLRLERRLIETTMFVARVSWGVQTHLEYCAYLICRFILFFYGPEVVFMHLVYVMELYVNFFVDKIKEYEVVSMWLEQRCWALVLVKRVVRDLEEIESL
jgi:hypothetical protein